MEENDANEYVYPVWKGIEGHEEFESTEQAVDKFFEIMASLAKGDFNENDESEGKEAAGKFLDGCGRHVETRLFPHVMSLIIGDEIQVEVGARPFPNVEKYDKFFVRGAGLG